MDRRPQSSGLGSGWRRAVDGAFDATVGRVGQSVAGAAVEVTGATAEQVIEGLEPYLVERAIPGILDGLRPHLSRTVIPGVLEDVTPQLVEEIVPRILDELRPYLEAELVPAVVDGLMPHLTESVAPELIDAVLPKIEQEVAPQIIDAVLPKIEQEVAPQIIDAVLPKIRNEVVPMIMNDIIDEPAVRDLIREQSQGLFLDTLEAFRGTLAKADTIVDQVGRHVLRRPPRPETPTALDIVMADTAGDQGRPIRVAVEDLASRRAMWRQQPEPPAPPGRSFAYAGAVTRLIALAIDTFLVGWIAGQGLSVVLGLLGSLFGSLPSWLVAGLTAITAALVPVYLSISYWATGRSIGMAVTGVRLCNPDGRRLTFLRSVVRAWALMLGLAFWFVSGMLTMLGPKRLLVLDRLLHTEVRYEVPEAQQRRHIRDALRASRDLPD